MEKGEFIITDDSSKLTMKGNGKLVIKTNITVVGTNTELPIDIVANFSDIPHSLHQIYYDAMISKYYSSTSIYNNTEPPKPSKDRIVKEHSWIEILTFGLYKTKKLKKDE